MKQNRIKDLLIEQLKKTPIIQIACEKTGVARASFYRWKQQDKEFANATDEAIIEGELLITDLSELQLINLIRDKNFPAINLWLKAHHEKYGNKVEINGHLTYSDEELTPEQTAVVKEAFQLASFGEKYGKQKEK